MDRRGYIISRSVKSIIMLLLFPIKSNFRGLRLSLSIFCVQAFPRYCQCCKTRHKSCVDQTTEQKDLQNKFPAECFTPSSIGIAFVARINNRDLTWWSPTPFAPTIRATVCLFYNLQFSIFGAWNIPSINDLLPSLLSIVGPRPRNSVRETSDLSIFRPTVPLYKISSTRLLLPVG